jgi:uncharacterized protein YegP (UPF0339 family)
MPRPGIWQRVHTDSGWHLRLVGANGEPVLTSEKYTQRSTATEALSVVLNSVTPFFEGIANGTDTNALVQDLDERTRKIEKPGLYYMAKCDECTLDLPFTDYTDRANWVGGHRTGTGHRVKMRTEERLSEAPTT